MNIDLDKNTTKLFHSEYGSALVLGELPIMTTGEGIGKALRNDMAETTFKIQELGFCLTEQPGAFSPGNKRE